MSDYDVIIGNLRASVAELEKALATAETAGMTSENVSMMEEIMNKLKAEIDRMYDVAMNAGLPEEITVKRFKLKDDRDRAIER
ncbi:MAG: hypothetical protein ABR582_09300 [Gemmatimonadaceae bacterium]